jgi:hypothetical protein
MEVRAVGCGTQPLAELGPGQAMSKILATAHEILTVRDHKDSSGKNQIEWPRLRSNDDMVCWPHRMNRLPQLWVEMMHGVFLIMEV